MLQTMTTEMRAKASATRRVRAATLRRGFADAPAWERLASAAGVRQPAWHEPVTTGAITRWCKRLGIALDAYRTWWGGATLRDFPQQNPDWPLRAWVGLVLEALAQGGARPAAGRGVDLIPAAQRLVDAPEPGQGSPLACPEGAELGAGVPAGHVSLSR
jgi:hypothetical protein